MDRELVKYNDDKMSTVINDLVARFMLFLPENEKKSPRVFQALVQAHWFYADFLAKNICKVRNIITFII